MKNWLRDPASWLSWPGARPHYPTHDCQSLSSIGGLATKTFSLSPSHPPSRLPPLFRSFPLSRRNTFPFGPFAPSSGSCRDLCAIYWAIDKKVPRNCGYRSVDVKCKSCQMWERNMKSYVNFQVQLAQLSNVNIYVYQRIISPWE